MAKSRASHTLRTKLTSAGIMFLAKWTPYMEQEMLGLSHLLSPGSVCIDVGSAAGVYTIVMSKLVGTTGRVHSVEPLTFAQPLWTRVIGAGRNLNVAHHSLALGAEPAKANMSVPVRGHGKVTGRSFLAWRTEGLGSNAEFAKALAVPVEVDTLDNLAARANLTRLDFIKIDVEGGELLVLEGGKKAIKAFKPAMLIEIEDRHMTRYKHAAADVVNWLMGLGYHMYSWKNGWQRADKVTAGTRNYLFSIRTPGVTE